MAPIFALVLGDAVMWSDAPVAYNIVLAAQQPNGGSGPPPSGDLIELEDGSGFIELEDGSGNIALES